MKICVFSDSHGYAANMINAIELEKPDLCFFLGDGERDIAKVEAKYPDLPVYAVRGNCDFRSDMKSLLICVVDGVKIFMTHGHLSNVKYEYEYDTLTSQALEAEAQIALFGHTHDQHLSENRGVMLLNPGSVGRGYYPSYAVLNIKDGFYNADLKAI
jgi:putative phosphoesterase